MQVRHSAKVILGMARNVIGGETVAALTGIVGAATITLWLDHGRVWILVSVYCK